MAVDTRNKRASALGATLLFLTFAPLPDGAITTVDKQHIAGFYSGIPAEAEVPETANLGYPYSSTSWSGYNTLTCANHDTTNAFGGDTLRAYIYCRNTSPTVTSYVEVGLYSDDTGNNRPQARLATCTIAIPPNTTEGWLSAPITYTLEANTKYWIAQEFTAYTLAAKIANVADVAYRHSYFSGYTPLPDPWPDSTNNNATRWCMYISYGTEAGASTIPVAFHHYNMMRG